MLQHKYHKFAEDDVATTQHRGLLAPADKAKVSQLGTAVAPVAVTYTANWSDFDATGRPVQYWKDALGIVHLEGLAKKSIATVLDEIIFTLPVGFRPVGATTRHFAVASNSAFGDVGVHGGTGDVTLRTGSQVFVSFDGITFRAA